MVFLFILATGFALAFWAHDPSKLDMLDRLIITFLVFGIYGLFFFQLTLFSQKDVRLIIYENGFWFYAKFLGVENNFIPWSEVNFFEKKSLHIRQHTDHFIVMHLFDKHKYDSNISFFQKANQRSLANSYQYIFVSKEGLLGENKLLDIDRYNLLHYLNRSLKNWRDRQKENSHT